MHQPSRRHTVPQPQCLRKQSQISSLRLQTWRGKGVAWFTRVRLMRALHFRLARGVLGAAAGAPFLPPSHKLSYTYPDMWYPDIKLLMPLWAPHDDILSVAFPGGTFAFHRQGRMWPSLKSFNNNLQNTAWNMELKKSNGGKKAESEIIQQSYGHKVTFFFFFESLWITVCRTL